MLIADADEATGENPPLFTPPKDFFATVSYDTDAGYLSNRVAIGSPATGQLLYKVDRFAPGTGPIRIDEVESTHLRVRYSRSPYSAAPPPRPHRKL